MRRPAWFVAVAVLLLVWGVMGFAGWMVDVTTSQAARASMSDWDRHFYANRPGWLVGLYGIAVWAGLIGAAALILRRRDARPFLLLSLVAAVALFGWMFLATDIVAAKGAVAAAAFPVVIVAIGAFALRLAGHARRRGWTG